MLCFEKMAKPLMPFLFAAARLFHVRPLTLFAAVRLLHVQTLRFSHALTIALLVLLAGCNARPLYSDGGARNIQAQQARGSLEARESLSEKLSAIVIDEAKDRDSQILRNQLIYLLNGGKQTQPEQAEYQLSLDVSTQTIATVQIDVGDRTDRTGRPSAGTVRARASYILRDSKGNILATGQRFTSAPFDRPRQEYANLRAEEDAKKRALEELANTLVLGLAHDLSS